MQMSFESPVSFHIELNAFSESLHRKAQLRATEYLEKEAALLESIMEIDKHEIYKCFGETHLTPYCEKYLGLEHEVAANFVRVARKSVSVPELRDAVVEGTLSLTKAKTIASVITAENAEEWIEKASALSKSKLECEIADAAPASKPEKARPCGGKRVRVEFEITEEEMRLFRRAQDLVSQKMGTSASLAETFTDLVKTYLYKHDPVARAQRSREHSSKAEVRHAVHRRDRGRCQARMPDGKICGATRWLHVHHIKPRADGGEDTVENLVTLCSSHHRLWHLG